METLSNHERVKPESLQAEDWEGLISFGLCFIGLFCWVWIMPLWNFWNWVTK